MKAVAAASLTRAALEAYQLEKLQSVLKTVLASNPFYSAKLKNAGVTADIVSLEEFTSGVPFTLKSELAEDQAQYPPYGSTLTYPLERYIRFHQTSGTTGRPIRWLDTRESWDWMVDCWARVYQSAQIAPDDRVFFAFSFGPFLGFWVAFDAAVRMGCLAISGGGMHSQTRLHAILDNEVTVLCSTPSYAVHLAEIAQEQKIDLSLSKLRRIIVAGEPGGSIPATRSLIEKLWPGARVVDHHGLTEIGPVSYECPERPHALHIMETAFFAEVIDPETREPVAQGELGELVLTNLGRLGSPLLRYRTGDIVRLGAVNACRCGSSELLLEGGIVARTDDMVVVRGVNVYPSAVEDILRSFGIAEFRVETCVKRALTEISIQIEPAAEDTSDLAERVATALQNALSLRVPVACVPRGTLPRFEGKARRWARR